MRRFSVHYAFESSPELPEGATSAFSLGNGLWAIPLACGAKTPFAVACWAADEHLPLVLWVEFEKPKDIEKSQRPTIWDYKDGEKAIGYVRTSGYVQFVGENEPRRFTITYTWRHRNGTSIANSGDWKVEFR